MFQEGETTMCACITMNVPDLGEFILKFPTFSENISWPVGGDDDVLS